MTVKYKTHLDWTPKGGYVREKHELETNLVTGKENWNTGTSFHLTVVCYHTLTVDYNGLTVEVALSLIPLTGLPIIPGW